MANENTQGLDYKSNQALHMHICHTIKKQTTQPSIISLSLRAGWGVRTLLTARPPAHKQTRDENAEQYIQAPKRMVLNLTTSRPLSAVPPTPAGTVPPRRRPKQLLTASSPRPPHDSLNLTGNDFNDGSGIRIYPHLSACIRILRTTYPHFADCPHVVRILSAFVSTVSAILIDDFNN